MPELPDVEAMKKYADSTALNKKISDLSIEKTRMLNVSQDKLRKALKNHKLKESRRVGKYLFLHTDNKEWLVLHFGMTGKLKYYKNKEKDPKHTRLKLDFAEDGHLAFVNSRKIGKIDVTESPEAYREQQDLGKDAMDVSKQEFVEILSKKKGKIKPALMDQHLVAGIGNIYADEILYQCRLHPETKTQDLEEDKLKEVYEKMQSVFKTAIKKDADVKKFPDNYLLPHRREGERCPGCGGKIDKIKVSGRSTYICPECQKK